MKGWQQRFRAHMERHGLTQEKLGGLLEPERTQATIGHWLRGFRKINLCEFFSLCEAAGADPRHILFGETSAEDALTTLRDTVLAVQPDTKPHYEKFEKSLTLKGKHKKKDKKHAKVND